MTAIQYSRLCIDLMIDDVIISIFNIIDLFKIARCKQSEKSCG
jgi:hypothetical protein